jgi:hypothetical protein
MQDGSAPHAAGVGAAEGRAARLFLVVDTNILLTHLAFLERLRKAARGAPAPGARAGGDEPGADEPAAADVVVVVQWIVLYELDRIKSERPDSSKGALRVRRAVCSHPPKLVFNHHPGEQEPPGVAGMLHLARQARCASCSPRAGAHARRLSASGAGRAAQDGSARARRHPAPGARG